MANKRACGLRSGPVKLQQRSFPQLVKFLQGTLTQQLRFKVESPFVVHLKLGFSLFSLACCNFSHGLSNLLFLEVVDKPLQALGISAADGIHLCPLVFFFLVQYTSLNLIHKFKVF